MSLESNSTVAEINAVAKSVFPHVFLSVWVWDCGSGICLGDWPSFSLWHGDNERKFGKKRGWMSLLSTSFTRSNSSLGYSGVDRAFEVSCNSEDQLKRSALG